MENDTRGSSSHQGSLLDCPKENKRTRTGGLLLRLRTGTPIFGTINKGGIKFKVPFVLFRHSLHTFEHFILHFNEHFSDFTDWKQWQRVAGETRGGGFNILLVVLGSRWGDDGWRPNTTSVCVVLRRCTRWRTSMIFLLCAWLPTLGLCVRSLVQVFMRKPTNDDDEEEAEFQMIVLAVVDERLVISSRAQGRCRLGLLLRICNALGGGGKQQRRT